MTNPKVIRHNYYKYKDFFLYLHHHSEPETSRQCASGKRPQQNAGKKPTQQNAGTEWRDGGRGKNLYLGERVREKVEEGGNVDVSQYFSLFTAFHHLEPETSLRASGKNVNI